MTDYIFRFRLNGSPQIRNDGGGQVSHDIDAVWQEDGNPNGWTVVPAHHKTMLVPADELLVVMAMPNNAAKVEAYKQLLNDHKDDPATPLSTDWTSPTMELFMDANDLSTQAASEADDYITVDLGLSYPVIFNN